LVEQVAAAKALLVAPVGHDSRGKAKRVERIYLATPDEESEDEAPDRLLSELGITVSAHVPLRRVGAPRW
jgi:hypothetical protein